MFGPQFVADEALQAGECSLELGQLVEAVCVVVVVPGHVHRPEQPVAKDVDRVLDRIHRLRAFDLPLLERAAGLDELVVDRARGSVLQSARLEIACSC